MHIYTLQTDAPDMKLTRGRQTTASLIALAAIASVLAIPLAAPASAAICFTDYHPHRCATSTSTTTVATTTTVTAVSGVLLLDNSFWDVTLTNGTVSHCWTQAQMLDNGGWTSGVPDDAHCSAVYTP